MSDHKTSTTIREAVVRFAGDSGDGMQLAGTQFSTESAFAGNDLITLPDYPAEIRAPAGTLYGVSSFQIKFGTDRIWGPGDQLDTLVAMNPAAFKVHLKDLKPEGTLIVNSDAFDKRNLSKAGYETNPLDDPALTKKYRLIAIGMNQLTEKALADSGLTTKEIDRCKNFFALGCVSQMYGRDIGITENWVAKKFAKKPLIRDANLKVLHTGMNFADNTALMGEQFVVEPAHLEPGTYRNLNGNTLLAYGLIAGAHKAGKELMLGSYPITPASDILHELARHKRYGVRTFQAEDEIAAVTSAIGASYAGCLGVTTTSGPGLALKGEALGLAVMVELPLVVVNVQRGGPSTGLPTKTEQADLLQAMYGRSGESPCIILAASTPGNAFDMAFEAVRLSIKYMTPVILLSDSFIGNGSAPWRIPDPDSLPEIPVHHPTDPDGFSPYKRDPETLARPWAIPGVAGLEHRLGGLEKDYDSGDVSYNADNHHKMVKVRAEKVARVADSLPPTTITGASEGDLLVVGWGSTWGAITAAVEAQQMRGKSVSCIHLHYLNPLPRDLGDILRKFKRILVPEINDGQLVMLLRARYLVDARPYNRIRGLPLVQSEIEKAIEGVLEELA